MEIAYRIWKAEAGEQVDWTEVESLSWECYL